MRSVSDPKLRFGSDTERGLQMPAWHQEVLVLMAVDGPGVNQPTGSSRCRVQMRQAKSDRRL